MVQHKLRKVNGDSSPRKKPDNRQSSIGQKFLVFMVTGCITAIALYQGYKVWPVWTVNWPSSLPKLVTTEMMEDPQLLWGTYRPGVYFGVKARVPTSPVFGIAWFNQYSPTFPPQLRHWCSQDDKLPRYGWTMHDGREFGTQEIVDRDVALNTTLVKFCHTPEQFCDWSARISAKPVNTPAFSASLFSLIFYVAFDHGDYDVSFNTLTDGKELTGLVAHDVAGLGDFKVSFKASPAVRKTFSVGGVNSFEMISDFVLSTLQPQELNVGGHPRYLQLQTVAPRDGVRQNLVMYQLTFDSPVTFDVAFFNQSARKAVDDDPGQHTGSRLTKVIEQHVEDFRSRFDSAFDFDTSKHKFNAEQKKGAMAAFSNLIGGVGYFYGYSLVAHPQSRGDPVLYGPSGLYTAVPSRSFFPRGFLWDEGFHTFVLSFWDTDITLQILSHWLDQLNHDGWIPREQILDAEARKRVPAEFIIQKSNNANPPTMFITFRRLVSAANPNTHHGQRIITFFEHAFPRLKLWVDWYLTTQAGSRPFTYRWRGRDADLTHQLNAKTLTSGLDDYPRASHPTDDEIHVDLRCWMAFVARAMADIGKLAGHKADEYRLLADKLYDNKLLNDAHWANELGRYVDIGLHSKSVKLRRENIEKKLPDGRVHVTQEVRRVVKSPPVFGAVGDSEGYVSLFPLLTQILDPNSDQLGVILKNLNDSKRMWTSFGLRSLSLSSAYYKKRNTEHDPPYWRGQIWVNLNFLVLKSLKHYASLNEACKYSGLAGELYDQLRQNLISNILKQYGRTGYFWEQYDDETGQGKGSHPFTGWTSLFVLMMAEKF